MRLLATIVIQPHVKKKITAKGLLHFPWDKATTRLIEDKATAKARMEKLLEKIRED